jgi:hypothetical protein
VSAGEEEVVGSGPGRVPSRHAHFYGVLSGYPWCIHSCTVKEDGACLLGQRKCSALPYQAKKMERACLPFFTAGTEVHKPPSSCALP